MAVALASATATAQETPQPQPQPQPQPLAPAPLCSPSADDLERRYQELLANQHRLEKRVLDRDARDTERASAGLLYGLGPDGFFIGARETIQVRFRAVLQADGRAYFEQAPAILNTFLIRRARPIIEGTIGEVLDFKLVPDFAGGQVQVFDAYVDLKPWRWLGLRGGKFKTPFGLERKQEDLYIAFLERGLPSDLAPDRDVGAALHGEVGRGALTWDLGILNGTADGASVDVDTNDAKDYVARLFSHPFRWLHRTWLERLGVGFAASWGKQHGNLSAPGVSAYKTVGQSAFFSYLADPTGAGPNVIALGDRYRFTPQLYYYLGPFGILAEYVYSATMVSALGNPSQLIVNQAWQVEATWVVTGEHASFDGITPRYGFNLRRRHLGALEVGARYGELRIDRAAFPAYADPTTSARAALSWGTVVNWHFTHGSKLGLLFERTTFAGGRGKGDRTPENALIARLQVGF